MAIVEMKRVSILAMASDREAVLRALQKGRCMQVTEVEGGAARANAAEDRAALESVDEKLARIRWTIGKLGRFCEKEGMLKQMSIPEASAAEAGAVAADDAALMGVVEAVEACERKGGELRGLESRLRSDMRLLEPWRALNIPLDRLRDTRETVQFIGSVNKRNLDAARAAMENLPGRLDIVSEGGDEAYLWIVAHRSASEAIGNALKAADFTAAQFPPESGTAADAIQGLQARLDDVAAAHLAIENELRAAAANVPKLKILFEITASEHERRQAATRFAQTRSAFLAEGWTPVSMTDALEKRLRAVAPTCEIAFRDPADDETPPTLLSNNRFMAPFEAVVANYSLPDPRGIDPTFIMAPFFACFFGMMVSDAGYGVVMSILIPLIIHFVKPKTGLKRMMTVLFVGGLCTVFWGAMFDTWFGESIRPVLLNPLQQPIEMIGLCLGFGVLHLFVALGVGAYKNIRNGHPLDAVFDQFFWFALILGLPMLILPATSTIGTVLSIVGAGGVLLTAGRSKPTLLKKLTGGLGALYGVTSWLSDILSYMRLFGMGLATGVIGMVINMLVGMILDKGIIGLVIGIPILVGGHLFNASINILGAYVHACRLQYIEFFGKFYDDGGVPFAPLAENPRYIAIRDDAEGVR